MFKVRLPYAQVILQSHSPSQVTLTNQLFQSWGGGFTSAGRSANFDSFSEIGYQSPYVFRIISEDQSVNVRWTGLISNTVLYRQNLYKCIKIDLEVKGTTVFQMELA